MDERARKYITEDGKTIMFYPTGGQDSTLMSAVKREQDKEVFFISAEIRELNEVGHMSDDNVLGYIRDIRNLDSRRNVVEDCMEKCRVSSLAIIWTNLKPARAYIRDSLRQHMSVSNSKLQKVRRNGSLAQKQEIANLCQMIIGS